MAESKITGIYLLRFSGTDKVYVGQSINILNRFKAHLRALKCGNNPKKLQEAYSKYGKPVLEIYKKCTADDLDKEEVEAMKKFKSVSQGFNTLKNLVEADYYCVMYYLGISGYGIRQIAKITGVPEHIVYHISSGENHMWLKDKYPEEYSKVEYIRDNISRRGAYMCGFRYPKIKSPEGVEYEVLHVTNFAKEHGLLQPKLTEVLHGTRKHHKGWKLVE